MEKALTYALASAIIIFGLYLVDKALRERNKNILWVFIFFGPISILAIIGERFLDLTNSALVVVYICISAALGLPTAIWGFIEIKSGFKKLK